MIPDNIKEEIEKAILYLLSDNAVYAKRDLHTPLMQFATKFYEIGKRDLVAALEELSLEQLKALKQRGEGKMKALITNAPFKEEISDHVWLLMFKHRSGVIVWRAFTFEPTQELINACHPGEDFQLEQLDMDLNVVEPQEMTA